MAACVDKLYSEHLVEISLSGDFWTALNRTDRINLFVRRSTANWNPLQGSMEAAYTTLFLLHARDGHGIKRDVMVHQARRRTATNSKQFAQQIIQRSQLQTADNLMHWPAAQYMSLISQPMDL